MNRIHAGALTVVVSAVLAACGGGGGDDAPPARATIVTAQLAGHASTAEIDAGTAASGISALTQAAACDVDVRYVLYMTRDPAGQPATASEAVFVPSGSGANCSGERPVVLYAHGTTTVKSYNIADVSRDTTTGEFNNAGGSEGSLVLAMFAAHGYIVVAPNYLGYDRSSLGYHPYLNAEAQAVDMVDGLRAAKAHLAAESAVKPSDKLFISGYSQGGHVAMATDKIIQRDYASEFTVTGSAPMSGPYNLVGFGDFITPADPTAATANAKVNAGATIFIPLLTTSYQMSYGDIYSQPSDVYQSPYAATIETLFPTDTPTATLLQEGKLPADATFRKLFGTGGLLTDSFATGYPTSTYRAALVKNTLAGMDGNTPITWSPNHPMTVCGGANDPTVFWALNGPVAAQLLSTATLPVPAYDLETRSTLPAGAVGDLIWGGFQQAKAAAGADVTAEYHGTLVPPFCSALARGFFDAL